jgi:tetraacyldisaccharide 4'-kinase
LTRGYRSGLGRNEWQVIRNGQVVAGTARANIVADEAMMQSRKLPNVPIVVGRNRKMAAGRYLQSNSQERVTHWILDDGFQHRQIARDTDIVLLDARSPAGRLLPAGRFREPASSLKRASMIIITKAETSAQKRAAIEFARRFNPSIPIAEVGFRPLEPECVAGVPAGVPLNWALVAGIANPQDFVAFAKMHGISPSQTLFVPDHCPFLPRDLNELTKFCDGILTTEKDFSRAETLFRQLACPVYVLPLTADWEGSAPSF